LSSTGNVWFKFIN